MKLRLYISGDGDVARRAQTDARAIHELIDDSELEVVDIRSSPEIAEQDGILSTPLLRRVEPPPDRRVLGNLRESQEVATYLSRDPY